MIENDEIQKFLNVTGPLQWTMVRYFKRLYADFTIQRLQDLQYKTMLRVKRRFSYDLLC